MLRSDVSAIARIRDQLIECFRVLMAREERCESCGARVHRTRDDVLAKVAMEHYDVALASEWSSEAPTKPDSGTIRAAKGPGSDRT